jgi:hypothetical protein
MNVERILMSALPWASEYCLNRSVHHAMHRKVFGEHGQYQAVQHPRSAKRPFA